MDRAQWKQTIIERAQDVHFDISPEDLSHALDEIAPITDQQSEDEEMVEHALRFPEGAFTGEMLSLLNRLTNVGYSIVLRAAERETTFRPFTDVLQDLPERANTVINSGSPELQRVARAFFSFAAEIDDLAKIERRSLLYHVLKETETSMRGLFFPSHGPFKIPIEQRLDTTRALLSQFAPNISVNAFISQNPWLDSERRKTGNATVVRAIAVNVIILIIPAVGILLVESTLWNTVLWITWGIWALVASFIIWSLPLGLAMFPNGLPPLYHNLTKEEKCVLSVHLARRNARILVFLSMVPAVIFLEVLPESNLWGYVVGFVQLVFLTGAFKAHKFSPPPPVPIERR